MIRSRRRLRSCLACMALVAFQSMASGQSTSETGVIVGRVLDEAGRPVSWAHVEPVTRSKYWNGPYYETRVAVSDETDDRGAFRLHSLPPGTYFVAVSYPSLELSSSITRQGSGYLRTYYPATASLGDAQSVEVRAGVETSVTIRLSPVPFVGVSGKVIGPSGAPVSGVDIVLRGRAAGTGGDSEWPLEVRTPLVASTSSTKEGTFELHRVPPGKYVVSALDRAKRREPAYLFDLAEVPISVDDRPLSGVIVSLAPAAMVRGRFEWAGSGPTPWPRGARLGRIRLNPVGRGNDYGGLDTEVNADGTFEFRSLYGLRGIQSMGLLFNWAIESLAGHAAVRDRWFLDVKPGTDISDLRVVITNQVCDLWATVVDEAGTPFTSGWVLIMPVSPTALDTRSWGFYNTARQNYRSNGIAYYHVEKVIPGRYLVAAIDVEPSRLTGDTELMERARAAATPVDLPQGRFELALKVVRLRPFVREPVVIARPRY